MHQLPPSPPQWPLMLLVLLILGGGSLCLTTQLGRLNQKLESLSYQVQAHFKQSRPTPIFPTPPGPTRPAAIDPITLSQVIQPDQDSFTTTTRLSPTPSVTPQAPPFSENSAHTVTPIPKPSQVALSGFTHAWQTWNNCGPATIAMYLSYFGRTETQVEAAKVLKPNQDDKNVSPAELAAYAQRLGFETKMGVGGTTDLLKLFLSQGFPVMVEFWTEPEDLGGMGHYRLLTGYDTKTNHFIAQDSLYGPNLAVQIPAFDANWQVFNRTYLLVYPSQQTTLVQTLLGVHSQPDVMFTQALQTAQGEAQANPQNAFAWFNLGTNYFHLNQPDLAASAFDQARRLGLPYRMLWYQFEIFETYLALGRLQEVIDLTTVTLNGVEGLEELYHYRSLASQGLNQPD